jgi:hypothetical protein
MADLNEQERTSMDFAVDEYSDAMYVEESPLEDPRYEGQYDDDDDYEFEAFLEFQRQTFSGPECDEEHGDYEVSDTCLILLTPKESIDELEDESADVKE